MNVVRVVSKLHAPFSSFFSNKFPLDSNWIPTKFRMNDWLVGCKFRLPPLTITHNFFCSFFALLSTPTGIFHRRSWEGEWGGVRDWLLVARFVCVIFINQSGNWNWVTTPRVAVCTSIGSFWNGFEEFFVKKEDSLRHLKSSSQLHTIHLYHCH